MTAQVTAGTVSPADVLGYITERGEAEIVLDAGHVRLLPEQGQAVTLSQ